MWNARKNKGCKHTTDKDINRSFDKGEKNEEEEQGKEEDEGKGYRRTVQGQEGEGMRTLMNSSKGILHAVSTNQSVHKAGKERKKKSKRKKKE